MKITLLGGSGFLGSHVAEELGKRGYRIKIFDKVKSKWLKKNQKMIVGNILNYSNLEKAIKNSDVVYHFAALADLEKALVRPIETVNLNILATVYVLDLCRKYKVKRLVYASSIYVNSKEGGFYRSSKKAAEDYIEEFNKLYGINFTIMRYGSLYGSRAGADNGVYRIVNSAIKKNRVQYEGNKYSVREYIHVKDAAKASVNVLANQYKNKHVNITGKKKIKVLAFLNKLSKMLGISSKINFQNKELTGHYVSTPNTYKPKKGKKFVFKSTINFYEGIYSLVNELKLKKKDN